MSGSSQRKCSEPGFWWYSWDSGKAVSCLGFRAPGQQLGESIPPTLATAPESRSAPLETPSYPSAHTPHTGKLSAPPIPAPLKSATMPTHLSIMQVPLWHETTPWGETSVCCHGHLSAHGLFSMAASSSWGKSFISNYLGLSDDFWGQKSLVCAGGRERKKEGERERVMSHGSHVEIMSLWIPCRNNSHESHVETISQGSHVERMSYEFHVETMAHGPHVETMSSDTM